MFVLLQQDDISDRIGADLRAANQLLMFIASLFLSSCDLPLGFHISCWRQWLRQQNASSPAFTHDGDHLRVFLAADRREALLRHGLRFYLQQ
jgi:hypothetical protein